MGRVGQKKPGRARAVTLKELEAGVELVAGQPVVLVVGGVGVAAAEDDAGAAAGTAAAAADPQGAGSDSAAGDAQVADAQAAGAAAGAAAAGDAQTGDAQTGDAQAGDPQTGGTPAAGGSPASAANVAPRPLRVRVLNVSGDPIVNAACDFSVGDSQSLSTDADGIVERPVQVETGGSPADGGLTFAAQGLVFHLKVGEMDPVTEVKGQQARLNNLGYFASFTEPTTKEEAAQFRWAVEEFQCDHQADFSLAITGDCDAASQSALTAVHGG